MDFENFKNNMQFYLKELNIDLENEKMYKFYLYMNLLLEWNKIMNLTGITEPKEIIIKHFVDSLTILKKINENESIIDVGTGAGFPGIPIKIAYPNTRITLLDSLNKRISFLNEVVDKLELKNIKTIHGRAEDFGKDVKYREQYDIATARAVAPLNTLLEYLMPFVRINGKCLCMKGSSIAEETENCKKAVTSLGGKDITCDEFIIPQTDIKRTLIVVNKEKNTPKEYPRKAGTPSKNPL